jgi:ketosteroid isomerase-like protein
MEIIDDGHDHDHDHGHGHGADDEATFRELMLRYAAAWDAGDLETILSLYHTPCAIYMDGAQTILADEPTKRRHFADLLERFRAAGLVGPELAEFEVQDLGRNSALVTARWVSRRGDGSISSDYLDSYHFGRLGETWKILDDTVHD